jgi:glycosyltransferase involved in cell wall biosynthesis
MRIAYISADRGVPVNGHSGSAVHVRELAHAFVKRGHEVTMFAAAFARGPEAAPLPWPAIDIGGDASLNAVRADIAKALRKGDSRAVPAAEIYSLLINQTLMAELSRYAGACDVVYERHSLWSLAGLDFARRAGLPFFLEVNAPLLAQQGEYRELALVEAARAIERRLLAEADRVIVTSPALGDYAHAHGASQRATRCVPCGVSPELFAAARPRRPRDGEVVVGFLGSLKPWHGIDQLLEAFRKLRDISEVYRLLIVGSGPLLPALEEFRRRHRLARVMTLAGSVPHARVGEYLAQMDIGVAPYPPLEPFYFSPLKVWEYAAAGVPIVASASGDLPARFPHRTAALLHRPGSVRKLVEHIERLRRDPELGQRLARRARRVAKLHTWDRLAARIESLAAPFLRRNS